MDDNTADADAVVIGSGPSGAIMTYTLAEAGFKVVCLEQGDWVNPSDYPGNKPEWELLIQKQWAHDPNVRQFASDYPLDVSASAIAPSMFNGVGGSTVYYGAEWPRLLPSDFHVRTLDGVADDWPITYAELAPDYDEIDAFMGVSGLGGDPAYPDGLDYPLPPMPIGKGGMRAAAGMNKLGWHWWPGTNAIPSQKFKAMSACARWGVCEWGCPESAKASADIAWWPHALKSGATLVTGARVRRIETRSDGRADAVLWLDRHGVEHRQRANAVVVCANGVGTPRLLLLSDSTAHPDGLGNSSGLVGKNLMLHPNPGVTGYYDDDLDSWKGPSGQNIHSMEFYDTRPEHDFVRGIKMMTLPTPGPLNAIETRREASTFDELWGPAIHHAARSHARGIIWAANTEDLPEEHNRVTLDPKLVDNHGIPAPKVSYTIADNTWKLIKFAVDRMEEVHAASGAAETFPVEVMPDLPGHLLGTARMGNDPATSVVDSYGRMHDSPNVFVADGSVFVTSGSANPTATISALALRIAKNLVRTAKDGTVVR
ncbi:GMC family oxidoreductase [Antrihabitans sp. YC2-6]|uniref:GMC family oxidoreductase n=1 Tax=Antrihabitans sp. YC2-6 TaxID=2799498 RepID=UPI001F2B33E3|nr:GMC family oxidoreductase [Antrihabitans sp. YC2-6]